MVRLGTKCTFSMSHHPQTDGQTERMQLTLQQVLQGMVHAEGQDWAAHLPLAEFAMNSMPSATTGCFPFAIVYGSETAVALPIDKIVQRDSDVPAANNAAQDVARIVTEMQDRMQKAQAAQKAAYDNQHCLTSFEVGARVWLSTEHITLAGSRKFKPHFIGPYEVLERIGELAYRLKLPPNMRIHNVFHVDRLRSHHPSGGNGRQPLPPVLDDTHSKPEYEIERIVE